MKQISVEEIESRVDRLIAAYNQQLNENLRLNEQLLLMEERQTEFKSRLDSLISKLENVDRL